MAITKKAEAARAHRRELARRINAMLADMTAINTVPAPVVHGSHQAAVTWKGAAERAHALVQRTFCSTQDKRRLEAALAEISQVHQLLTTGISEDLEDCHGK